MIRALLLVAVVACGGSQIPRNEASDPGQLIFNGYTKPDIKCFKCHDGTGAGTKWGPALATRLPTLTDAQLETSIRDGKGEMPAFRGQLTDAELLQVTTWLRHQFGGPPAVAAPG